MLEGCIRAAVIEFHKRLTMGMTPHIVWANNHAYVITEEDFPGRIYCHDGDPRTDSALIQRILDAFPSSTQLGEVKDDLYKIFRVQIL